MTNWIVGSRGVGGLGSEDIRRSKDIPAQYAELVAQKHSELLMRLADADDEIAEMVMEGASFFASLRTWCLALWRLRLV